MSKLYLSIGHHEHSSLFNNIIRFMKTEISEKTAEPSTLMEKERSSSPSPLLSISSQSKVRYKSHGKMNHDMVFVMFSQQYLGS